jgi:hypothetical protein
MDIEAHIKESVLDQDHLADILTGYETCAAEIRARVVALLESGVVELYTYRPGSGETAALAKHLAVAAANEPANWAWHPTSGNGQNYFLGPVKLADGRLAYGIDSRD